MVAARQIDGDTLAANAVRTILTGQLADLCSPCATAGSSHATRGLREMRTAARHLSYTIEYFKPFMDYAHLAAVHQTVEEIIGGLGGILDEETFVKSLTKLQPEVPTHLLSGVELLIEERRLALSNLRQALSKKLSEQGFAQLQKDFKAKLELALRMSIRSDIELRQVANGIVLTCLEEMTGASTALYRPSKTRTSHRLRISVRKLRYALDLFAPYLGRNLESMVAELAALQAALGKLRNCDLKLNALGDWLTERHLKVTDSADMSPQWQAAIWLLGYYFERRPKHYRKALAAGQELLADSFATRVASAVSAGEPPEGSTHHFTFPSAPFLSCTNEGLRPRESND